MFYVVSISNVCWHFGMPGIHVESKPTQYP